MPRATNRRVASTIAATALVAAGLVTGAGTASTDSTSFAGSIESGFYCGRGMPYALPPMTCHVFGYTFQLPQWLS